MKRLIISDPGGNKLYLDDETGAITFNDFTLPLANQDFVRNYLTQAAGGGLLQKISVRLDAAQLETLNSSPVVIVPPPGPGLAILYAYGTLQYEFGTVEYEVSDPSVQVVFAQGSNQNDVSQYLNLTNLFNGSQMAVLNSSTLGALYDSPDQWSNQSIFLIASGDGVTAGDGIVVATVYYSTLELN